MSVPALSMRDARARRGWAPGISGLIYGGFFVLVAVIVAASLFGAEALRRVERTYRSVQHVSRANELSGDIERRAYALRLAVRDVVLASKDPQPARAISESMARQLDEAAPSLSRENRDLVDEAVQHLSRIRTALAPGGIASSAPALDATTLDDEAHKIGDLAGKMRVLAARDSTTLTDALTETILSASRQTIASGMICVLLGGLCALLAVRRTVSPLRAIVGAMGRVAAGTTDASTPFLGRGDEVGDIARATEALKDAMTQVRVAQASAQRALLDRRTVEEQYQQLFEQSADGIYQTTPDGRLLRANPSLIAMMGYGSLAQMLDALGTAVESVYVDPGDHARFRQVVTEHGAVRGFEYRAKRRDGAILWLSDSATVVRDATGTVVRYEGMLRDITDQKAADAALAESQRRLREVIDTVPASINVKDRDLRFSIMNRYMATLLGVDPEHAIGRTTGELLARYSRSKSSQYDQEVLRTRKPLGYYEDEYPDASGTMRYWLTTKIPILDEGGEVDSIVTCALDIGERKRAEAAFKAAKEAAEAATETKSQFLAQMSHEIRTPMNGVLGMIEVLEHTDLDAAQRKLVGTVRDSASALLRIINDILDLSKLEANRLELEQVAISFPTILAGVEATLAAEARGKGLTWSVELDPRVPHLLRGDPIRLRQVLLNLAANAVKFTSTGGVQITVARDPAGDRFEAEEPQLGLQLAVRDTGIGMDGASAARLFEPFTQDDPSITRRFGGTGLGLSICRRIVTLMGGTIAVRSAPGQGATFTVSVALPLAMDPAVTHDASTVSDRRSVDLSTPQMPDGDNSAEQIDIGAMRALFGDDTDAIRLTLSKFLVFADASVDALRRAADALDSAALLTEADRLMGAAATIGAHALSRAAAALSVQPTAEWDAMQTAIDRVDAARAALATEVRQLT